MHCRAHRMLSCAQHLLRAVPRAHQKSHLKRNGVCPPAVLSMYGFH